MSSKLKMKAKKERPRPLAPLNVAALSMEQLSENVGCKVSSLMIWKEEREKEMQAAFQQEFNEKLYQCEDYIAVANILITLMAINKTWGFKKAANRVLENYNECREYIEEVGVIKAYEQMKKEWGTELEFEEIDMKKMLGN